MENRYVLSPREEKKYAAKMREKDAEALEYLLSDPKGRWFLIGLGFKHFMYSTTFTGNSTSFFNEGRRQVVLEVYDAVRQLSEKMSMRLLEAEKERFSFTEKLVKSIKEERGKDNGKV